MRLSPSLVTLPAGSRYLPGRARHRWASRHQHHGDVDRRGRLGRPFRRTRHRRWTCACSGGRLARNPRLHRPPPSPRSRARRWPKATEARATRPEPDLLARRKLDRLRRHHAGASRQSPQRGFFVLDVHTGATTRGEKAVGEPPIRWSRDGSRIASTGGRGIWPDVRVTNANVSQTVDPTRGTPRNFAEEIPLWSPNGRLLAYNRRFVGGGSHETYRKAAAQSGVYVVSPSGGAPRKLIGSTPPSGKDLGTNEIFCSDWSTR